MSLLPDPPRVAPPTRVRAEGNGWTSADWVLVGVFVVYVVTGLACLLTGAPQ